MHYYSILCFVCISSYHCLKGAAFDAATTEDLQSKVLTFWRAGKVEEFVAIAKERMVSSEYAHVMVNC
jgi:hypothetical protein